MRLGVYLTFGHMSLAIVVGAANRRIVTNERCHYIALYVKWVNAIF
jgi:hypothetical protein